MPAALWAFARHQDSPEEAIVTAVNMGGDTDTIGSMCGAVAGAYHGAYRIPGRWVDELENEEKGRDYLLSLADRLFEIYETRKEGTS